MSEATNTSCQQSQDKISSFSDEFHFLSNFHAAYFLYEGVVWPTSEHAYQAMKCLDANQRLNIAMLDSPAEAKKYAKSLRLRSDWEEIKVGIMEDIVRAKFLHNPMLKAKLLATEDLELIEGNDWGDVFWGVCKGKGENMLGKILMKVREEIRNENT